MKSFLILLISFCSYCASGQTGNTPRWLRNSAISPDGQWIAFEYKGDIFKVPSAGGTAIPVTITPDYESNPIWSHDGKSIAFASDRYGNFDVYIILPAVGQLPGLRGILLPMFRSIFHRMISRSCSAPRAMIFTLRCVFLFPVFS